MFYCVCLLASSYGALRFSGELGEYRLLAGIIAGAFVFCAGAVIPGMAGFFDLFSISFCTVILALGLTSVSGGRKTIILQLPSLRTSLTVGVTVVMIGVPTLAIASWAQSINPAGYVAHISQCLLDDNQCFLDWMPSRITSQR
jgi:hypothetical protein